MENKKYAFSDSDIKSFFKPNLKFIHKYSDLQNMESIDELFDDTNFVVLLIEEKLNNGHWVALMKYDDGTILQFDPYGGKIDDELKYISNRSRSKLGESGNRLTDLLGEYDGRVIYNHYRFQKLANHVNTCGRWCVLALLFFLDGFTIEEMIKKFKWLRGLYRMKNDDLVTMLIPRN